MTQSWQQFVMPLGDLEADRIEAALLDAGALSVTYSDSEDDPVLEPGLGETPLWSQTLLTALFDADTDLSHLPQLLATALQLRTTLDYRIDTLEDRAWEREWLKDFRPMQFGRRLVVCPGDMPAPDPDNIVVRLDPGLAFGTGTHPTTAMCLEWLDQHPPNGESILDFGSGSGILAIAALKLGAMSAVATDIDPQALLATQDNAARNMVTVLTCPVDAVPPGPYDVVLANILAGPLAELANQLSEYVKPGGRLALSGILMEQADSVQNAYSAWIQFDEPETRAQDGQTWVRLSGQRF